MPGRLAGVDAEAVVTGRPVRRFLMHRNQSNYPWLVCGDPVVSGGKELRRSMRRHTAKPLRDSRSPHPVAGAPPRAGSG